MKHQNQLINAVQSLMLLLIIVNEFSEITSLLSEDDNETFEESMQLKPLDRTRRATVVRDENRKWIDGVVPYEIENKFTNAQRIQLKKAMLHWENATCIRFVERDINDHPDYIVFTKQPCGCCSDIGRVGNGPQYISIGDYCNRLGLIIHELGHVVGFYHEHVRPDRDEYVKVVFDNIMWGVEDPFVKKDFSQVDTLGQPYDYYSIMHYSEKTYANEKNQPVLIAKNKIGNKYPKIGQRVRLSKRDIIGANLLYECPKCGRTFIDHNGTFGINSKDLPGENTETCVWRITAKASENIALNINFLNIRKTPNCTKDYLVIRDGYWDKSPLLGIFCGHKIVKKSLLSTRDRMYIKYVKSSEEDEDYGFQMSYKFVENLNDKHLLKYKLKKTNK